MRSFVRFLLLPAALSMPALPVLAQQPMPGMSAPAKAGAASGPADAEMMAGMAKMNRDMGSAAMTGDPDRDFVAMMIPHHQGAIDMAKVELHYGKDPQLRRLAHDIVLAQEREIAEMKRSQAAHRP